MTGVLQISPLPYLRRRGGLLLQAIRVRCSMPELTADDHWTLRARRGSLSQEFHLRGREDHLIFLPEPDVLSEASFEGSWEGGDENALLLMGPVRRWTVHLVLHSHTDLGFTAPVSEVARLHNENTDRAIEYCRETAHLPEGIRFRWTCEVSWQIQNYIRDRHAEKVEELMRLVRAGEIGVGALYSGELTGLLGHEEAVRAFSYAGFLRRRYGIPCDTAMLSDVPGCTSGFVQVMAKSGVSALIIADNNFLAPFLPRTDLPRPFLWRGSDNTEVLCWYTDHPFYAYVEGEYYGFLESRQKVEQMLGTKLTALELQGYPHNRFQIQYAFDNAPLTFKPAAIVREWAAEWEYPRIILSTASEFLAALRRESGKQIPSRTGDWADWWGGIVTGFPADEALARECHGRTPAVETLLTHVALRSTGTPVPDPRIARVYDGLLAFDEHSGGGNIWQPGSREEQDRALREGYGFLHSAVSTLKAVESDAVEGLAALATHPDGDRLRGIYNPSGIAVSGSVEVRVRGETTEMRYVRHLPPYSWRLIRIEESESPSKGEVTETRVREEAERIHLESPSCRISIERRTGRWVSFVDNDGHGELVAEGDALNTPRVYVVHPVSPIVLGKYIPALYDGTPNPGEFLPWPTASIPSLTWDGHDSGTAACIVEHRINGRPWLVQRYQLRSDQPGVAITNTLLRSCVADTDLRSALTEFLDPGGMFYFHFPFSLRQGHVEYESTASILRHGVDQFRGACLDFATVQRWCAVRGLGGSALLTCPDTPLIDVGSPGLHRYKERPDDHPSALFVRAVTLRDWGGEDESPYTRTRDLVFRFGVSFIPGGNSVDETTIFRTQAHRRAVHDNSPLIQFIPAAGKPGNPSALEGQFLALTPDTVEVLTLKPADMGDEWVIRLREAIGVPTEARLSFPGLRIRACRSAMMTEEPVSVVLHTEENVVVSLAPFALCTLLLDLSGRRRRGS